ncbi:unnamed protein product [Leptidea sinapis]|uniref:RNA 2-O ribose methyltransferase substrate binding domain-containing protein n=1 Tax=Leptidea sinapis TaxID=189913 RepID=A0A5E4Q533_9NEOP|nr:unnamed protein product [Leptidea sinapis]
MSYRVNCLINLLKSSIPGSTTIRLYSRWTHRRPSRVILPFEENPKVSLKKEKIIDLGQHRTEEKSVPLKSAKQINQVDFESGNDNHNKSLLDPVKGKEVKAKKEELLKKQKNYLSQKKVFDDDGNIIYEKLKENDSRISSLFVKLKSKKERLRTGQMLVEGWRLIVDGLEAKCKLQYIIFSQISDLNNLRPFLPKTGVQIFKIPYKEIEMWSDVVTSPGILGVFERPTAENIRRLSKPLPLQFICDNIRVPGNLGAILRAAVGVGCEKVLLTKGCVDLWDPKVVRSAAGAHFRQPIHTSIDWEEMLNFLPKETSVFIADSNIHMDMKEGTNVTLDSQIPVVPYYGVDFTDLKHMTVVLGGETEGISVDTYRLAASRNGIRLNIPLQKGVDSLNTGMAAAVIGFEIRKQLVLSWAKAKAERDIGQVT